jgi:hypothetical protein
MMMSRLALLALIPFAAIGCNKPPPPTAIVETRPAPTVEEPQAPMSELVLFDQKGKVVARCELALPENAAAKSQFSGSWRLLSYSPNFPKNSTSPGGQYTGHAEGGRLSIDLNPGVTDSNVVLDGKVENGKISGEWILATVIGGTPKGTFELDPAK